jgi:hypothetical protein
MLIHCWLLFKKWMIEIDSVILSEAKNLYDH